MLWISFSGICRLRQKRNFDCMCKQVYCEWKAIWAATGQRSDFGRRRDSGHSWIGKLADMLVVDGCPDKDLDDKECQHGHQDGHVVLSGWKIYVERHQVGILTKRKAKPVGKFMV